MNLNKEEILFFVSSVIFLILSVFTEYVNDLIIVILLISALYAFVGDYLMSYLKRKSGIKDTGSILPGHGGILDRVDSHLSATVIFTFLYISFQMIAL